MSFDPSQPGVQGPGGFDDAEEADQDTTEDAAQQRGTQGPGETAEAVDQEQTQETEETPTQPVDEQQTGRLSDTPLRQRVRDGVSNAAERIQSFVESNQDQPSQGPPEQQESTGTARPPTGGPPGGSETIQDGQPRDSGSDRADESDEPTQPVDEQTTGSGIPVGPGGVSEDFDPQEDTLRIDDQGVLDTDPNRITRPEFAFGTGQFDRSQGISPVQKRELAEDVLARAPGYSVGDVTFDRQDGQITAGISREAQEERLTSRVLDQVEGPINPRNLEFEETDQGLTVDYTPIYDVGVEEGTGQRINDQGLIVDEPAPGVSASATVRERAETRREFTQEFQEEQVREQAAEELSQRISEATNEDIQIGEQDVELTEGGAQLTEETQDELQAIQDFQRRDIQTPDLENVQAPVDVGSGDIVGQQRTRVPEYQLNPNVDRPETGLAPIAEIADPRAQFDALADTSAQTTQFITENVAQGSETLGEGINIGVDVATSPIDIATGQDVDISGEGALGEEAGQFIEGAGTGLASATVGLPAFARTAGEVGVGAARFTAENPTEAPEAAFDVTRQFVESEAARAQRQPVEFGGELTGEAIAGFGIGRGIGQTRLAQGRTGAALRRIDVGTRTFRRARAETRGLRGVDTSDLARDPVLGQRIREGIGSLDFDEFLSGQRGQLELTGRQRTETDREPREFTDPRARTRLERQTPGPDEITEGPDYSEIPEEFTPERIDAETLQRLQPERMREIDPGTGIRQGVDTDVQATLAPSTVGVETGIGLGLARDAQQTEVTQTDVGFQRQFEDTTIPEIDAPESEFGQVEIPRLRPEVDAETRQETTTRIDTDLGITPTPDTTVRTDAEVDTRIDPSLRPTLRTETTPDTSPDITPAVTPDPTPDPSPDPRPDPGPPYSPPTRPPRPPGFDLPDLGGPDDEELFPALGESSTRYEVGFLDLLGGPNEE